MSPSQLGRFHLHGCADYTNCFFDDPTVDWNSSLVTEAGTSTVSFNSTAHRKIRLYRNLANGIGNGHGTHTQGTLLGSPLNTSDVYNTNYRCSAHPVDTVTCVKAQCQKYVYHREDNTVAKKGMDRICIASLPMLLFPGLPLWRFYTEAWHKPD